MRGVALRQQAQRLELFADLSERVEEVIASTSEGVAIKRQFNERVVRINVKSDSTNLR
ncbi:hypothetical protein RISK_004469 [Rhodopirellula islandica]|uniref:Uncharacterized protein n=1 Tax=Rhodopirellula islandica TaxID=595434 RepID=A0A0J1B9P2_RHOIS|nr:hypothetical protein RISK_004469 [Rhodopirellula islandica]